MTENADLERRHFLTAATTIASGVGIVAAAVPFVASFNPSARALALGAPVEVDISKLEVGAYMKVEWRGRAIMIVHRSQAMLDRLAGVDAELKDPASTASIQPDYAANEQRSRRPEMLVVEGVCTHLGCAPIPRFEVAPADLGPDWVGGFYCPCHGSKFDLAGRVFRDVPAPTNLTVPPYSFLNDGLLQIGSDTGTA